MSGPLVSVIIPTHNRLAYLQEAMASVRAQTHRVIEMIVVDDASTDGTHEHLSTLAGAARVIRFPKNRERAAARNAGLRVARGECVAFLDSDDRWLPEKLADDLALLAQEPQLGSVYSPASYISADGAVLGRQGAALPSGEIVRRLWTAYFIPNSSMTIRRTLLERLGGFSEDPALSGSEDWELWMRLAAIAPIGCVRRHNVHVRVHQANTMANPAGMERSMLRALRMVLDNPALMQRLAPWRAQGESAMYLHIAIAYAAAGQSGSARQWLRRARQAWPAVMWRVGFLKTWLRSLRGSHAASEQSPLVSS